MTEGWRVGRKDNNDKSKGDSMKSCYDCFNLVATIPMIHSSKSSSILTSKLNYPQAKAKCKFGLITDGKGRNRTFKRVLSSQRNTRLIAFNQAINCPEFSGESEG